MFTGTSPPSGHERPELSDPRVTPRDNPQRWDDRHLPPPLIHILSMNFLPFPFRLALCCLAILASLGEASVQGATPPLRAQDEFFCVNTRPACCTTDAVQLEASLAVEELAPVGGPTTYRWMPSHFDRLREGSAPGALTIIYVHGNQISHHDAHRRGLDVYRAVTRCADGRPVRFILWSWPASKIDGVLKDFRVKALRTRPLGWQLAWALDQLPVENEIALVGYSYGARIIGGAMHVLAGGDLGGLALPERVHPDRAPLRVAFLAPATHAHWYGQGQFHGKAMEQIDRLWTTVNPRDPAMQFYSWSAKGTDPQAFGYKGPCCLDSERRSRIECCNVEHSVGRSHDLYEYIGSPRRMEAIWRHLSPADVSLVVN
jgi:hypothetical protein